MNLFDNLVAEALKNKPELSQLRVVVEKELLHHDIFRILNQNDLLTDLTFIGGTALRLCYGSIRLSEDLDFTGGKDFSRNSLSEMGQILSSSLQEKYGLAVVVSEPIKETKNVSTWKIKIETKPKSQHLPAQRINIDICSVPSYDSKPMMLINPYGIDMGTNGLVIQTQSREEIYTDKLLSFALRPNRIKYRDLWDIIWLHQQGLKPKFELLPKKIKDRKLSLKHFFDLFEQRFSSLSEDSNIENEFKKEMCRFLISQEIKTTIEQNNLWSFIINLMSDLKSQIYKSTKK